MRRGVNLSGVEVRAWLRLRRYELMILYYMYFNSSSRDSVGERLLEIPRIFIWMIEPFIIFS